MAAAFLWLAAFTLRVLSRNSYLDLDVFHELALARFIVAHHFVPLQDPFSYTSTVPFIHHEWGTGMMLYPVVIYAGAAGLVAFKFLLVAAILILTIRFARKHNTPWSILIPCALLALNLGIVGYPTIRAQFFTLLFMILLLHLLERDRQGKRWWPLLWFPLFVLWLNLHGGFLVGIGILALHVVEQTVRTRRLQWRLLLTLLATLLLTGLNPYGYALARSVVAAITLPRPNILEWQPLWHDTTPFIAFLIAVALLAYALRHSRISSAIGLPLVLITAILALLHTRHISLFAVAWLAYVPPLLAKTPPANYLHSFALRRAALLTPILLILAIFTILAALHPPFWQLQIPTRSDAAHLALAYPVGPAQFLAQNHITANVMTPYNDGSYLTWKLYPNIKVSLDSRYEVAYSPELATEIANFYAANPGWQQTLTRYPTDLVLARNDSPVVKLLPAENWSQIYRDETFALFANPSLHSSPTTQPSVAPPATFP